MSSVWAGTDSALFKSIHDMKLNFEKVLFYVLQKSQLTLSFIMESSMRKESFTFQIN